MRRRLIVNGHWFAGVTLIALAPVALNHKESAMAKVFITYRRSDTQSLVGRLTDDLIRRYGRRAVFKDADDIPPGTDFAKYIHGVLKQCVVQLVVIGPAWQDARTADGQWRLHEPDDWVRIEIETGMRLGLVVLPVLLGGGRMPTVEELPASLQAFTQLQAITVRDDPEFKDGVRRVTSAIDRAFATRVVSGGGSVFQLLRWQLWIWRRWIISATALVLAVASVSLLLLSVADPTRAASIAFATATAAAAKTAAANEAQATQTAAVQEAEARQTVVAQATATAAFFLPYRAAVPGAPCDTNGGLWSVDTTYGGSTITTVSCDGQQFTMTSSSGHGVISYAYFQWPNHPQYDSFTLRVRFANRDLSVPVGVSILGPDRKGYEISFVSYGGSDSWRARLLQFSNLAEVPFNSTEIATGQTSLKEINDLVVTVSPSDFVVTLNGVQLARVPRASPSFTLEGGGITLWIAGHGTVAFSNFAYEATR